jgi:hypothetical protein
MPTDKEYQTPGNAAAGKPPLRGALYYAKIIGRGGRRIPIAVIEESGDQALCSSAAIFGWYPKNQIERTDED